MLFGELHGKPEPGKKPSAGFIKNLMEVKLIEYKIECMIEVNEYPTYKSMGRPTDKDNSINWLRRYMHDCLPAYAGQAQNLSKSECPANVHFSWIDPSNSSELTRKLYNGARISNDKYLAFHLVEDDDMFYHMIGGAKPANYPTWPHPPSHTRALDDLTDADLGSVKSQIPSGRLIQECAKLVNRDDREMYKLFRKQWDAVDKNLTQRLGPVGARTMSDKAWWVSRFAVDAFTVCRILRNNNAQEEKGWRQFYIVYEGAWHVQNVTRMLKANGYKAFVDLRTAHSQETWYE